MRQAPRHLAPSLGALSRYDLRDIVKHQQSCIVGHDGAACQQGDGLFAVFGIGHARAQCIGIELKGLLPMV